RPAGHAVIRLRGEHRRVLAHDRVDLLRDLPLVVGELADCLRPSLVEVLLLLRRLPLGGGRLHSGTLLGAEPTLRTLLRCSHSTQARQEASTTQAATMCPERVQVGYVPSGSEVVSKPTATRS